MDAKLKAVVSELESLEPATQSELADLLEEIVASLRADEGEGPEQHFSAAELEEIHRIAAEPFVAADPAAVKALFAKHGL